jgi:hypothetical protein
MAQNETVRYRERVKELEEENRQLRRAATAFGELAERLNAELREERRLRTDRRAQPRQGHDRRQCSDPRRDTTDAS